MISIEVLRACRDIAVEEPARDELAPLDADDVPIGADREAQLRLGRTTLRAGPPARRNFGKIYVGAGDLANIEAVAGLAKLLLKLFDGVALSLQVRRVAQDVHVGLRGVEQGDQLNEAQGPRARCRQSDSACPGVVVRLEAVE